jgi:gas vesicle protein
MADSKHTGDFLAGLIVGSLVGAAAALLFAPQSGEETRAKIRERGIELQERAGELSSEARQRSADLQMQAREKAGELSTQAKDKAAGVQTKVKQVVVEGKSAASRRKEDLLTGLEVQPMTDELHAGE